MVRSRSNDVGKNTESQNIWERWDPTPWDGGVAEMSTLSVCQW